MTSTALSEKILTLARKLNKDPSLALRCIPAVSELAGMVEDGDIVIWPEDMGGLAWIAGGKPYRNKGAKSRTVFCVTPDYSPYSEELWHRLDTAASSLNNHIVPICLNSVVSPSIQPRYPRILQRILDKFFSAIATDTEINLQNLSLTPISAVSNLETETQIPELFSIWLDKSARRVFLNFHVNLHQRIMAATAAAYAGLHPLISLKRGEAATAASLIKTFTDTEYKKGKLKFLLSAEEDWEAVSIIKAVLDIPVLTPLSDADFQGALDWALKSEKSIFLLAPGKHSLPVRALHKSSWESSKFLILKEKKDGSAGSVLLIVPGVYAREAGKAADRLYKNNFTVAVAALRITYPADLESLRNTAEQFDLVIVSDPSEKTGGIKAELGLSLMSLKDTHIAVTEKYLNGKDLAGYAELLYREDRFHRTVDDVKKDRWR
ncbi:MAG: hypothetical protein DRP70_03365 [Spirochaetes bacterium]|nr:MAG: hypothetical protein DRP60_04645 [Spirochaetota bacterium]RKX89570.1 MAG: hypothetical protein DRP70_03365 [Spirochaetota bacterium]RKX98464.1 MAG: hypothetical protein DRZ90_02750 [Spirochaetota bacterium]